ncbi:MAG: alpha/beta hydrolase fold domain-containing protein [Treponema sp.]|nr:alpha/beta hydrolase fold domain-containing protein [Treponema sp.]
MNGNRKAAIKKIKNLVLSPKQEIEDFRKHFEENFATVFLPDNVHKEDATLAEIPCNVFIPELSSADKFILYIHGGSFAGGSSSSYCNFCSLLANNTSCRVVFPEFRLPPTYSFPASIDDVVSVFKALLVSERKKIIVAADGSGASIAIALLFRLSPEERRDISNLVLFSPWLDFTSSCELIRNKKLHDDVLSGANLHRAVDLYTYAANFANPLISPLQASDNDFFMFPSVYIQLGEKEIIMQQVRQFEEKLKNAGVPVEIDAWKDMMFMFQMANEFFTESHLALQKLGSYINKRDEVIDIDMIEERNRILRKNDIQVN